MHAVYDRDERQLLDTAADELWTDHLLDAMVDVSAPILEASAWDGLPDDAPPRTAERLTAAAALASMALRTTRVTAMTVRAGYAAEALGSLRRLFEITGHARRVVDDASGQYAENWLRGRGKADRPRVAFGASEDEATWKLMSGQAHAEFAAYANHSAALEGRRIVHYVGPRRDAFWDSIWLWVVARQLTSALAGLLKVHDHIDQADFLAAATALVNAEARIENELEERRRHTPPPAPPPS